MSDKTGGPAFPERWTDNDYGRGGMTLRDWFAGQCMAGLMSQNWAKDIEEMAGASYLIADAMLKERDK